VVVFYTNKIYELFYFQEQQNLEALKEQVQRNSQLSEKMVDILTSFENRLGRLQQTILPIYNEMENLQLKKTSVVNFIFFLCLITKLLFYIFRCRKNITRVG